MTKLINLTPHAIALRRSDDSSTIYDGTRDAARINIEPGPEVGEVDGVPIIGPARFLDIDNLPPRREGILLIVSQLTALAVAALYPDRDDILYPGTGPAYGAHRDSSGGVLAVRQLVRAT